MAFAYFSDKVEKRTSAIDGTGLFARAAIAAGEIVVVKGGHIMTRDERDDVAGTLGPAEFQISDDLFIGPRTASEREHGMMHINHSCEPNAGIRGQIIIVAMRNVTPGEEITLDYATGDDDDWEMTCRCGAATCRGTVTGTDWKRSDVQEKYAGWFSTYLQQRIEHE